MKPRLTPKQRLLVQALANPDCPSISEAGRQAGYAHESSAHQILRKPHIKEALKQYKADQKETANKPNPLDKATQEQIKEVELAIKQEQLAKLQREREENEEATREKALATWVRTLQWAVEFSGGKWHERLPELVENRVTLDLAEVKEEEAQPRPVDPRAAQEICN